MEQEEKYKNIKEFIRNLQKLQLDVISNLILADEPVSKTQIRARDNVHAEIRRKIAYVARIKYNIQGITISKYLNISKVQVSTYIHSAHDRCKVDKVYSKEIDKILNNLR